MLNTIKKIIEYRRGFGDGNRSFAWVFLSVWGEGVARLTGSGGRSLAHYLALPFPAWVTEKITCISWHQFFSALKKN